jgi:hypothetical protein
VAITFGNVDEVEDLAEAITVIKALFKKKERNCSTSFAMCP